MKVKIILIDDSEKEFSAEVDLSPSKPSSTESSSTKPVTKKRGYLGLKGGVEFLIDTSFFKNLRSSKEVYAELKKDGYFYTLQSVDKRLRFLVTKRILTRIEEEGIWKYAIRQ